MSEHHPGYEEACRAATIEQGLDPIIAALTTAGIDHSVEQTGGMVMVVNVPLPGDPDAPDTWLGITRDFEVDGQWWMVLYKNEAYESARTSRYVSTEDAVATVRRLLDGTGEL